MTTYSDRLYQLGGVPVGNGSKFYGWWKDDTYFVDYDNGLKNNRGKKPDDACKYLADAISLAGKWDTIYVRPRDPDATGGDANYHTPESATNWTVTYAKYGLAIIGTGIGHSTHPGAYQTYLRGHASVTTGSVLTLKQPFAVIENLAFHRGGGSSTGIVYVVPESSTTSSSFSGSVNNCLFRFGNGTSLANAALVIQDSWYTSVYNSTFYRNRVGIGLNAINSTTRAVTIRGCVFEGAAADVDAHIASNASATYITIADNVFQGDIPAKGGSYQYYIYFSASGCTGLVSNNFFGAAETTVATLMTLNGLTHAGNFGNGGEVKD